MIPAHQLDGPSDAPALVLLASLGSDRRMWEPQAVAMAADHRVVRVDARGHGASQSPPGEYDITELSGDVVELLDHLGLDQVHLCGLSLGGLTALQVALDHPGRLASLTVANSAARVGSSEGWQQRIDDVTEHGLAGIRDDVLPRFCAPGFDEANPVAWQQLQEAFTAGSDAGYAGCCAALRDADLTDRVGAITTRTLVVGGELDVATPPAQQAALAAALPDASLVVLDGAAHLSNLDRPLAFTTALREHLTATH